VFANRLAKMRVLLIVSVLALVAFAAASTPARSTESDRYLFSKYARHHSKTYTVAEVERRFAIFQTNLDYIQHHNAETAAGVHSFKLGLTQFADMTNAEYRKILRFHAGKPSREVDVLPEPSDEELAALPASVDWRTAGIVTDVKNQGSCGSCWSFSSTGSLEGAHAQATGTLVSLSEENLVDCVLGGADNCETGGWMSQAFDYVISNGGIDTEASYPYVGTDGNPCTYSAANSGATISSYVNITSGSESALQTAAAARTVSVAIDASSMEFQLYTSGVYDDSTCQSGLGDLDHGVLVVGYGNDAASGKDYWLVKNSWTASWGLDGYIWMSRNANNQCGIATCASYPIV